VLSLAPIVCIMQTNGPAAGGRVTERDEAIARIMQSQMRMYHLFAFDRSDPLLTANLTMPQLKALLVISLRPGSSGQDITAAMGISLATVTGIVDRLAAQGLVSRREDPHDRRVRRIDVTPAGAEFMDGIITAGAAHQRRLLDRLDAAALDVVERAVAHLLAAAEAELAGIEGSPCVST
jgi:DNA-binding MarR family transcriptional regulator